MSHCNTSRSERLWSPAYSRFEGFLPAESPQCSTGVCSQGNQLLEAQQDTGVGSLQQTEGTEEPWSQACTQGSRLEELDVQQGTDVSQWLRECTAPETSARAHTHTHTTQGADIQTLLQCEHCCREVLYDSKRFVFC